MSVRSPKKAAPVDFSADSRIYRKTERLPAWMAEFMWTCLRGGNREPVERDVWWFA